MGASILMHDGEALLTITRPIVSNWKTEADSSIPNGWARGSFLRISPVSGRDTGWSDARDYSC